MKIDIDCDCEIKNVCCEKTINELNDTVYRHIVEHNRAKVHGGHPMNEDGSCQFYCRNDREDKFMTQCIYGVANIDNKCNEWCKAHE